MKVLEINVDDIGMGGVFSLVKNVIENKDKSLDIDIATIEPFERKENIELLNRLGCNVFYIGYSKSKILKQFYCIKNLIYLIKKNNYDCVHIHADVANKLFVSSLASKLAGVQHIIIHSHASGVDGNNRFIKRIFHKMCVPFLKYLATDYLTCSDLAAKWMFPNIKSTKVVMIKNGVHLSNFKFNIDIRNKIRKENNLDGHFVIGHVGRFAYQKNHEYLINVFAELTKEIPNAKLLLIGEGILKQQIEEKVRILGLNNKVIFYGTSNNVANLFMAMDVFVLPSHFEGLPIVGVEAQATGLPVIFSDKITKEARLINEVHFLPIDLDHISQWCKTIKSLLYYKRYDTYYELINKRFDISQTVETLNNIYQLK